MVLQATPPPPRVLPAAEGLEEAFWTGGNTAQLLITKCATCDLFVHPPKAQCPTCSATTEPVAVTGRGVVYSFTVNHQPYHPDVAPPYIVAIVELADQADLRVVSNIVGCDPDAVRIGLPVEVGFERHGARAVPVFTPSPAPAAAENGA